MKAKKMFFTLLGLLLFTNVSAGPTKVLYAEFSDTDNNGSNETMTLKCSDTAPDGAKIYQNTGSWNDVANEVISNIVNVIVDGSCANYDGTALQYLFWQFPNLTTITGLTNLNTNSVESMRFMFEGCPELTSLDLSSFNTSNVTDMNSMFSGCTKLETIYVSRGWTTDKVSGANGDNMFKSCSNLRGSQGSTLSTCNGYNVDYAHIDATNYPGYLTEKNSIIRLGNNIDNSSIVTAFDGLMNAKVELIGRTLYKDGKWNTLCLPFNFTAEQIAAHTDFAGAKLMELNTDGKNGFDATNGTLYLAFKEATAINAGVPYLVKWDAAGDDFTSPVFSGVTINATATTTVSNADTGLAEVQMVGCYSPVSVDANDKSILFLGDNNTLYYSTENRNIRSCRAYFSVPYINQTPGAKARAFVLNFDDEEATGILEISADSKEKKDDAWYSLAGVRLSGKPTQRGMYINKGNKVIIK